MKGHGEKLTRKQGDAIAALLSESTVEAAALKAGVAASTLGRWLADDDFKGAYRDARSRVLQHAVGRLQRAAGQAVDALVRNLSCQAPPAEVSAARALLDAALKATQLVDVEDRVEELETTMKQMQAALERSGK